MRIHQRRVLDSWDAAIYDADLPWPTPRVARWRAAKDVRQLGQLEAAVMARLWAWSRPVSVREVLEDLERERSIAYTTVMTVLDNLNTKGVVRREKDGRAYRYVATLSREEYTAALLEQVLFQSEDRSATLLHFVGQMSEEELGDLRRALDTVDEPRNHA